MISRSRNRKRSARGGKHVVYKEPSSDDSSEEESQEESPPPPPKKHKAAVTTSPIKKTRRPQRKNLVIGAPRRANSRIRPELQPTAKPAQAQIVSDGRTPDWASLPYEILRSIFRYATHPFLSDEFVPNNSHFILLRYATLCKSFTEPALAALYESPPMVWGDYPHRILKCLTDAPQSSSAFSYKTKIKQLDFDVRRSALSLSVPGFGQLDLSLLLRQTPQLASLRIFTGQDRPPFRPPQRPMRWAYSEALFDAIKETGCRLQEFRWNGALTAGMQFNIKQIHEMSPFKTLRSLAISQMDLVAEFTHNPRAPKAEFKVDALLPLEQLESLSLESCLSLDWPIFQSLPKHLTMLTVINCSTLTSDILEAYLAESGRHLKVLVLNHNQSLDLQFIPGLKEYCPKLEHFGMDLTFYSSLMLSHADHAPSYVTLLTESQIPTWPSSLQTIELLHLRNWTSDAAANFFDSLVSAAPKLPHLRKLVIKAMLDISWRDRAGFREKWINKLRKVFLRRPSWPNPHLASSRAFRIWKQSQAPVKAKPDASPQDDETARAGNKRRSTRIQDAAQSAQVDLESGGSDEDPADAESTVALPQGLCEVVDINIDNLRPSETRFNEADFLDTEASGDEEWTGQDRNEHEEVYAWRR